MTADPRAYAFDERQRMIPADPEALAARVAAAVPGDFADYRRTGIELMLLGRYEEALDHLDRALETVDTETRAITVWINLADVYRYRGDAVTAIALYRRAVDAARDRAPEVLSTAVQHLGKALAEQGDTEAARALLREALRLRVAEGDPESIESARIAWETVENARIPLPPMIAALFGADPEFSDDHEGMSGGVVRVNGTFWMKRGPRAVAEYARLNWLRDSGIRVPDIAAFESDVLVLADAGVPSLAAGSARRVDGMAELSEEGGAGSRRAETVGATLGTLLRDLHALPTEGCPFDGGLDATLAPARRNVLEGLVDSGDFDDDHAGSTPEDLLRRLVAERPDESDLVVTHGDFTPANVLEGGILIDVDRLGVADRYRDLALAERDLREDFGAAAVDAFFDAYGLADPDRRRSDYYRLVDELF
ncbi:aminoglycoside 3'-phosphotransferase [Nocardia noduli]|uniref:aminoglycoside 3'-phosphotransferase n=1 Tax=Nocardia noduli TaxID=2815722 RepID=UPI001C24EBCC|nr:phosphotransferase [Nocardia noduli]